MAPLLLYFQIVYSWLKHVTNGALSTGPFLQLLPAVPFLTYSVTPAWGNKMDAEGSLYTMSAQQHQRYWLMDGLKKEAVGKLRISPWKLCYNSWLFLWWHQSLVFGKLFPSGFLRDIHALIYSEKKQQGRSFPAAVLSLCLPSALSFQNVSVKSQHVLLCSHNHK